MATNFLKLAVVIGSDRGSFVDINFGALFPWALGEDVPAGTAPKAEERSICCRLIPDLVGDVGFAYCEDEEGTTLGDTPGLGSGVYIFGAKRN